LLLAGTLTTRLAEASGVDLSVAFLWLVERNLGLRDARTPIQRVAWVPVPLHSRHGDDDSE
jgi:hypothetical protein